MVNVRQCIGAPALNPAGAACDSLNEGLTEPREGFDDSIPGLPRTSQPFIYRFFGGPPLAVIGRLVLLSILVGVILAAIGLDPWNIIESVERLIEHIWNMGFDAVRWLWRYFLLGAVIVVPIWFWRAWPRRRAGCKAGEQNNAAQKQRGRGECPAGFSFISVRGAYSSECEPDGVPSSSPRTE